MALLRGKSPTPTTSVPRPDTDEAREESQLLARAELLRRLHRIEKALDTVADEWQRAETKAELDK